MGAQEALMNGVALLLVPRMATTPLVMLASRWFAPVPALPEALGLSIGVNALCFQISASGGFRPLELRVRRAVRGARHAAPDILDSFH